MLFYCIWIKFSSTRRTRYSLSIIPHHFLWLTLWDCIWTCLHCSLFIYAHASFVSTKIWVWILFLWWLMTTFHRWMHHLRCRSVAKCSIFIILDIIIRSSLLIIVTIWLRLVTIAIQSFIFPIITYLSFGNMRWSSCCLIWWIIIFVIWSTVFLVVSSLWNRISSNIRFESFSVIVIFRCGSVTWKNWGIHCVNVWIIQSIIGWRIHWHWRFRTMASI